MVDDFDALRQVARVRERVVPELAHGDVERLVAVAASRRERRRIRRSLGLGLAIGAVSASVLWLVVRVAWLGSGSATAPASAKVVASAQVVATAAPVAASPAGPNAARTWALSDQSRATALDPATDVVVEEDAPRQAQVRLERGRARFEVKRRSERTFRVRAGNVTVNVIGTVFAVEIIADRIGVSVEQGAVEVDWGVGKERLVAGEQGWFPPLVLGGGDSAEPANGEPAATAGPAVAPERAEGASASQAGPASARELLAESDAARARGETERGAELLRRVLREHPNDARAPLAAFTLGRLLLNELKRPREAAAAFHEVQVRAPRGQFAEDALAREVEAWKQASDPVRARALAQKYVERYPAGRHLSRVKALAGLE
jgi:transmembrane sensor